MLVVASSAHRYEDQATPELHGEHLLERISALENALARVTVIAEQALTLALQQTAAASSDRLSLMKLAEALEQGSEILPSDLGRERSASARESKRAKAISRSKRAAEPKSKRGAATKGKARRP